MNKMLVSDYDQTFYLNDADIALNKKYVDEFVSKKNIFVIATGRSYLDFKSKHDIYNFYYDYAILNHGATIINMKNEILSNISIDNNIIPDLKKALTLEKSIAHFCCSKFESRVEFEHKDLTKIHVTYASKEYTLNMLKMINEKFGKYVNVYYVAKNSIEIISKKTDKAKAIYEVMKINNIDKSNVYTIGDGYSDIKMIKEFNGYNMHEAILELKEYSIGQVNSVSDLIKIIIE